MTYKKLKSLWRKACASITEIKDKRNPVPEWLDEQWQYERDMEKRLIYYEYTLHHRLRSIWARINGLNHLLDVTENEGEKKKIRQMLSENLIEMDNTITDISNKLSNRQRKRA